MRKEYDFSKGVRGKHAGHSLRVVGDSRRRKDSEGAVASKIQKAIERDLKRREGFKVLWKALDEAEKKNIRTAWLETIDDLLEKSNV
ncbi:MAG TPA: hypothetical protein VEX60_03595 [Pyrinomonadaceae bacterium]|nr:hypothetical protein [Pyrinomonadaceae bacterium]